MLSPQIRLAIKTLSRGSEGISAVLNMAKSDENRFAAALADLQRLADENDMPIAIVGGLGAIRYGYPAATQDIDIGVSRDQLDKLITIAKAYGFAVAWESKIGWHTLMHDDVEINVVPEGGRARDTSPTTIPGPIEMGVDSGLQYAKLESWVELKVSSGRQKDHAHIVEVLKKTNAATIEKIAVHLGRVHQQYLDSFEQLRKQAIEERDQENHRR